MKVKVELNLEKGLYIFISSSIKPGKLNLQIVSGLDGLDVDLSEQETRILCATLNSFLV